ncbi:hypothetical protein QFZ72_003147 [Bacillus sp. V2I10]|nr:hypothetical protein [Bacillus sp. V2I10]
MTGLNALINSKLIESYPKLQKDYESYKTRNLSLDMSRGKPGPEQLALSMDILDTLNSKESLKVEEHIDIRNYGSIDGLKEAKELFAQVLQVSTSKFKS